MALHRAVLAAAGKLWLDSSHPKQREVHQFNVDPLRLPWTTATGEACHPSEPHSIARISYRTLLRHGTKANFPTVKIFKCLSDCPGRCLHQVLVYRYFHLLHVFQGTLNSSQEAHYGCSPLPRLQFDSTGNLDNKAKVHSCMDSISLLAATTAQSSNFAPQFTPALPMTGPDGTPLPVLRIKPVPGLHTVS